MRRLAPALLLAGLLATAAASAATITGTPRADRLTGTARPDTIDGRGGNDTIRGLAGADFLQGGPGRDAIDGGAGDDRIPSWSDGQADTVRCGAGRDVVDAEAADVVGRDCEVVSRQISRDTTTDPIGQHETEAEPDSFAFGSTVVAVFQVGRVFEGGAVAIGFSTSRDAGRTWATGLLPGVTASSPQPGAAQRASDPVVAYDAVHGVWLATTLGISPATASYHLYVNRSPDGLSWSAPVAAVNGGDGDLDKEWLTCDNGVASRFRGRCYLAYYDVAAGPLKTTFSDDGGLTWSAPVAFTAAPPRGLDFNGAQPMVLPDGTLVIVYNAYASGPAFRSEVLAVRSRDGGASFEAPVSVAPLFMATIPAVRTFSLPSAEVDGGGRMYVAWEGCVADPCRASRILLSSSSDGVAWTPRGAITVGAAGVDHFLPGIGADPSRAGRLTLVYHSIADDCANTPHCPGVDVFSTRSTDGGVTWGAPQRLTAAPVPLAAMARTRTGLMLGDYVSTSYAAASAVSVFCLAATPGSGGRLRQATFAYRSQG